jgi:hypothetical protein
MNFLRSLLFNFVAVFFINQIGPGTEVGFYEHVPNIGADALFSLVLGFLNACVFPALFVLDLIPSPKKIAILTFVISFAGYIFLALVPVGIQVTSFLGILVGGSFVWGVGFLTNYLEWLRDMKQP